MRSGLAKLGRDKRTKADRIKMGRLVLTRSSSSFLFVPRQPSCIYLVQTLDTLITKAASLVWVPWLVFLLLGTHFYLTWRTGFIQRHLRHAIRLSITKDTDSPGDISQFGALASALAATIGKRNIYGAGKNVGIGGCPPSAATLGSESSGAMDCGPANPARAGMQQR